MKGKCPHGSLIERRLSKNNSDNVTLDLLERYNRWAESSASLNSELPEDLQEKVRILNEYKDFVDALLHENYFKMQDKISSSIIEEFLFYLFKDIPSIKSSVDKGLIYMGSAKAYTDLSFAPKDFKNFFMYPNVLINHKNQDFTISKNIKCIFVCNKNKEERELTVPAVAIECKTYIPSTMLGQSIYEAQLLKQGNPYSLYIIVAEQNALSDNVSLKNIPIDEIFILRKQKRNVQKNGVLVKKNPIDAGIIQELYDFVKSYLSQDWFDNQKATERGRLIN